jgi:glycosyltransferase involved in cell wall biosynthesis
MKIDWLITELNTLGGAETYVRQMAPYLQQIGQTVRVITFMPGGSLVDELRNAGVTVIELGLQNKQDWKALARLGSLWRTDKPDLVHTHLYHAGIVGRIAARIMRVQTVIVHQHGAERARSHSRTLLDRATSPLVSKYIATCQAVAETMQKREGIPGKKITVIYNGIECVDPVDRVFTLPQQAHQSTPVTIICVGRLSPEKGHITLLKALAQLKNLQLQAKLILIGEGKLQSILIEQATQLGIIGLVQILGSRRDVIEQLVNANIFALPSEWEGISMALLEAMAAGLPVVATAVGGTPEVVIDGETGYLVPPRDPASFANALSRLIQDPGLRQRMGMSARQRVCDQFNIRHTAQQILALYETLCHS